MHLTFVNLFLKARKLGSNFWLGESRMVALSLFSRRHIMVMSPFHPVSLRHVTIRLHRSTPGGILLFCLASHYPRARLSYSPPPRFCFGRSPATRSF